MDKRTVLKYHKKIGVIFAPFFLLSSFTAVLLLFRKDDLYSKDVKNLLLGLHNWEYGAKYIGMILAFALMYMSASGLYLYYKKKK
jgi:uncharacterized iron-regulated membrane protein